MTATSAASTLGESWNRRHPVSKESFAPQPMAEGLRFSPPSLATLDRPQGRVLVVVDDALVALDLQRLLHEAGYRVVGPATTVAEIQVPFVYLTTGVPGSVPVRHRQRPVVEKPFTREILLAAVEKAMARPREVANDNRWPVGASVVPWTRVYPPL